MTRKLMLCLAAAAALTACKREAPAPAADAAPQAAAPAPAPAPAHAFSTGIAPADFAELVKTLSSDAFEGRGPGTAGEDKTVAYIRDQMQRIGLQPGNGDSWFQDVAMTETTAAPSTTLTIAHDGAARQLAFGTDMVVGTRTGHPEVKLDGSDMVFVGYGVDAPEQKWNDYAGQDWKGKTVVMFVNDPGFHTGEGSLFEGKRMTYYGRWTYKFEEAARKGAAAALIVHDTPGASYGWDVVKNSWSGAQYDLPAKDDPEPRIPVQGWITADAAKKLFADAGLDLAQAYKDASKRGFKPIPLKAKLSVDLKSTIAEKTSRNVVGVLPGGSRADEAVLYMAHWDHLGKHDGEPGDNIYNGAVDNATGVAGILEIAEAFAHQQPKPERSVVFLAVTLEESGLLGSKYYVAHPTFPLNKIAGVINLDAMPVAGRAKDLVVNGFGSSQLEDLLKPIAAAQGRVLHAEDAPQSGFYFRSDHFNFAKAGVPALYIDGGEDLIDGGIEAGRRAAAEYAKRYHSPADEYDPATWKLDGVMDDLQAVYGVGKELAAGDSWPNWYPDNPFKAARDKMMGRRTSLPATAPANGK
ncbi:M28 family metallopeptidase [Xanthomonas rydalmerensis]|uniref:M28 family metallopeptidase n=1 Tax=Xanthomonas rydalmerensis TaxID=3046274 RepID=A0ABZ0JNG6_9XANT|nr:M28 family metallopeptidase [Xanthomonas sp. DM-2023]WOS41335.1 M28 family metallopeptidase [Xanthomonas sp. DM-2023]WOS45520.1 M28 family metallopeptidase [Xanthomonas sp. DM-2023]WOS49699.1 M28 family metallopeptidase [Xanthomonas sp. DM-2023]WOS53879.1 M28 family metallopeptidase [Xanthomonas sp. DM-2023]WOS58062.1 M28 family metallopeptidase [Xanthomonas sp. DM-2023]